jgi:hypothetical protein
MDVAADPVLDLASYDGASVLAYWPDGYEPNLDGVNRIWGVNTGEYFGANQSNNAFYINISGGVDSKPSTGVLKGSKAVAYSWIDGNPPDYYRNGLFDASGATSLSKSASQSVSISIGAVAVSYIRQIPSSFGGVLAFAKALTETEHAVLFDALQRQSWSSLVSSRSYSMPPVRGNETGLVAGYNMRPKAGKILDASPARNDADVQGPHYEPSVLGDAVRFDGVRTYADGGSGFQSLRDVTVSFWLNAKEPTVTSYILNYYLSSSNGWGVSANPDAPGLLNIRIYDDIGNANSPRYLTAISAGVWHHIVAQMDSLENKFWINGELVGSGEFSSDYWDSFLGTLFMGVRSAPPVSQGKACALSAISVHNRALTPDEIKAEYNAGARTVLYQTGWGARETVAGLGNTDWQPISGAHKVITTDYQGEPHKGILCTSAGAIALPASLFKVGPKGAARGGFRWVMSKASGSGSLSISIIGNQPTIETALGFNGYTYRITAARQFQFIRFTNGGSATQQLTAGSVVDLGALNACVVDVEKSGRFGTYLNGELIDLTGGIGTNPFTDDTFTDSAFIIANMTFGDILLLGNQKDENGFIKTLGVPVE